MTILQKSLLLLLSALPFMTVSAQDASTSDNIEWSAPYSEPPKSFLTKIIHTDKTGFYGLRVKGVEGQSNKPTVYVEHYLKDGMKLKSSKTLDLKFKGKTRDFEDVIMMKGNNMYFLTSFNNQAKKKNYLFAQSVNIQNMRTERSLMKIAEVPTKNIYKEGGFNNHLSKDTSKVLIYAALPKNKKQPERFSLQVFDQNFNALWAKEIALPFDDDRFQVEEYRVDNQGNVYMLGVVYQDQSKFRRSGQPTYQYILYAYRNNGKEVEEYKVDLGDKFITDLTYRVARNGDLVFSGFYSEKGNYSVKGTYFFRLNPTTKAISNKNLKAFDFKFLTEYLSDKKRDKAKKASRKGDKKGAPELYQYALDELILRSDGGAVLIAEQYFVERDYDYNNYNRFGRSRFGGARFGNSRFNSPFYNPYGYNNYREEIYTYNYNDIIVVNIKPTGEIEWTARIPKHQETTNDGGYFSSYAMSVVRDKFHFVFNDNPKNFDPNDNSNRLYNYDGRNAIISLATIDRNGQVSMKPLFDNKQAGITTRPKICKQIGRNEMLIYGERGRKYRFGNLKL